MSRRKKILLLGKNGMLGSAIVKTMTWSDKLSRSQFIAWDRSDLDITRQNQVIKKISELKPDVVINATGYTDVDGAESERQKAFAVNADAVNYIAEACSQISASLIHFSTDYVFDGSQSDGYIEDDVRHLKPVNVYGESKLQGEVLIQTQNLNLKVQNHRLKLKIFKYFIIRTSWLYGAGGKNFVDTMIARAKAGQTEFKVVDDQFGLPTWTLDLAERVLWMVDRINQLESGVYHITNSKIKNQKSKCNSKCKNDKEDPAGITWYEFAMEIFRLARKTGILSNLPIVKPCTSDEFPRTARRPKYSALINTKLPEMREWRKALCAYLKTQNLKFHVMPTWHGKTTT